MDVRQYLQRFLRYGIRYGAVATPLAKPTIIQFITLNMVQPVVLYPRIKVF